jgi:hypothetical protein
VPLRSGCEAVLFKTTNQAAVWAKVRGSLADGRGVCGTTAGNKLQVRFWPELAEKGEEILGGGPLNKGVIQLLYAGTGRESRTISGPEAAVARDHEESATPTVG